MDFRELNYVLAIEKYQNITKAADSLYVSQPTLSKFLMNLENTLGQKLFRKLGNKYILTYVGEQYVKTAKEILLLKSNLDIQLADILKVCILSNTIKTNICIYYKFRLKIHFLKCKEIILYFHTFYSFYAIYSCILTICNI